MITRILLIVLLLCFLCMGGMYWHISLLQTKVENLGGYKALYEDGLQAQKTFKDKEGKNHNKTQQVELTHTTLKAVINSGDKDLSRILKEVPKIKNSGNNLESFSSVAELTENIFKAKLKDTLIFEDSTPWDTTDNKINIDTVRKPAKHFEYRTKWDTYKGVIYNDSAYVLRQGVDSLDVVCYWERSWFLGAKTYSSETISLNPDTKITATRSVTVKKKGSKRRKWRSE